MGGCHRRAGPLGARFSLLGGLALWMLLGGCRRGDVLVGALRRLFPHIIP